MSKFNEGNRYTVYLSDGKVGVIDCDEFVRSNGKLLYRIDGEEVYTVNSGNYIAEMDGLVAMNVNNGDSLFRLELE